MPYPFADEKRESRNSLSKLHPKKALGTAVPTLLTSGSVWKSRPPECLGGDGQSGMRWSRMTIRKPVMRKLAHGSANPFHARIPRWARRASSLIQGLQYCSRFPEHVPQKTHENTQKQYGDAVTVPTLRDLMSATVAAKRHPRSSFSSKSTLLIDVLAIPTSPANPKMLGECDNLQPEADAAGGNRRSANMISRPVVT